MRWWLEVYDTTRLAMRWNSVDLVVNEQGCLFLNLRTIFSHLRGNYKCRLLSGKRHTEGAVFHFFTRYLFSESNPNLHGHLCELCFVIISLPVTGSILFTRIVQLFKEHPCVLPYFLSGTFYCIFWVLSSEFQGIFSLALSHFYLAFILFVRQGEKKKQHLFRSLKSWNNGVCWSTYTKN